LQTSLVSVSAGGAADVTKHSDISAQPRP